jgi:hypothetical protein
MCAVALKRRISQSSIAAVPGAKLAPFPGFITPCDPTLRDRPPDGPGWLHEIKIDGYRAQVHSRDERRPGLKRRHDWSTGWSDQGSRNQSSARVLPVCSGVIPGDPYSTGPADGGASFSGGKTGAIVTAPSDQQPLKRVAESLRTDWRRSPGLRACLRLTPGTAPAGACRRPVRARSLFRGHRKDI